MFGSPLKPFRGWIRHRYAARPSAYRCAISYWALASPLAAAARKVAPNAAGSLPAADGGVAGCAGAGIDSAGVLTGDDTIADGLTAAEIEPVTSPAGAAPFVDNVDGAATASLVSDPTSPVLGKTIAPVDGIIDDCRPREARRAWAEVARRPQGPFALQLAMCGHPLPAEAGQQPLRSVFVAVRSPDFRGRDEIFRDLQCTKHKENPCRAPNQSTQLADPVRKLADGRDALLRLGISRGACASRRLSGPARRRDKV